MNATICTVILLLYIIRYLEPRKGDLPFPIGPALRIVSMKLLLKISLTPSNCCFLSFSFTIFYLARCFLLSLTHTYTFYSPSIIREGPSSLYLTLSHFPSHTLLLTLPHTLSLFPYFSLPPLSSHSLTLSLLTVNIKNSFRFLHSSDILFLNAFEKAYSQ